jgi:hypothetical protein
MKEIGEMGCLMEKDRLFMLTSASTWGFGEMDILMEKVDEITLMDQGMMGYGIWVPCRDSEFENKTVACSKVLFSIMK